MKRPLTVAYIGLGSNLNNPEKQLKNVIDRFALCKEVKLLKISPNYHSFPCEGSVEGQPNYVNAVISLATDKTPLALLALLQKFEKEQGKDFNKSGLWEARPLDLDLLLFGKLVIKSAKLTIPHPRMLERDFVLRPLLDIAPHLCLPDGRPIEQFYFSRKLKKYIL